jgi:glucose-1-phosphate thymidylyltransferase
MVFEQPRISTESELKSMLKTRGILLAGGRGTRLAPITNILNKHLIPVYDKPMIYYPLSTLMMCGIRQIAVITNPEDVDTFKKLLGDGSHLGLELEYFVQENPNGLPEAFTITEEFIAGCNSVLMLGDNLLIGQGLGTTLETHIDKPGASILAFPVTNPEEYGVVEFDSEGTVVSLEEKPSQPKSHFAIPGIYFMDERAPHFAKSLTKSSRGELEITDLLRCYLAEGQLSVTSVKRGTGWMDAGTTESLYSASELVRVLQNRQGYRFNVPEEIAFNRGWITTDALREIARKYKNTSYGNYLASLT